MWAVKTCLPGQAGTAHGGRPVGVSTIRRRFGIQPSYVPVILFSKVRV